MIDTRMESTLNAPTFRWEYLNLKTEASSLQEQLEAAANRLGVLLGANAELKRENQKLRNQVWHMRQELDELRIPTRRMDGAA